MSYTKSDVLLGVFVLVVFVMIGYIFSSPFHPYGIGEEISTGTVVAYEKQRGPTDSGPWTFVYLKTEGEDTIRLSFMGDLGLDLKLGKSYQFVYHTEPWDVYPTLDSCQEVTQ